MGSPLGPTFAEFYMANLEKTVFNSSCPHQPKFYTRYVDDTLTMFENADHMKSFMQHLKESSCLNFTCEKPKCDTFQFLDVEFSVDPATSKVTTGIFTKESSTGISFNYHSNLPPAYKTGVIKTLIHRAYKLCSTWSLFDKEIQRIRQNFTNEDFPLSLIDRTIRNLVYRLRKSRSPPDDEPPKRIQFYLQTHCVDTFETDKKHLSTVLHRHVKPINHATEVKLALYYKPKKIGSIFSLRARQPDIRRHGVVYQFHCNQDSCNATYIGYTSNSLLTRASQHKYQPSKIHEHFVKDHSTKPNQSIIDNFTIMYSNPSIRNLKIAEALLIREHKPIINVKFNEMSGGLAVFT